MFSGLPVVGKLICCPREFDYLMLVVFVSMNKNNKTLHMAVLNVMWNVVS